MALFIRGIAMSNVPNNLKYTETHEWLRSDGGTYLLGITDHAQDALGDVVFVELPEVGRKVAKDEAFAVVESVKAASDIYAPISGEIVEVNAALNDEPAQINAAPYDAWLVRIKAADEGELELLLTPEKYQGVADSE